MPADSRGPGDEPAGTPRGNQGPGDGLEAESTELAVAEEHHLRRNIGYWQLTAIGFSGVIGSGWLLAGQAAAQAAGPEAILTWIIGGLALLLIALVMVELGGSRPESGGLVRWPFYTNGRLVATLVGWGIWIAYATNPPSESAALLQYMSQHVGGIYNGTSLTGLGVLLAIGIMALLVVINWFGVALFANVNAVVTVAKFVVPTITVVALFVSGFHGSNFHSHGFAPNGFSAGLSAIATAGIIYAYTGFQGPIDLSGEARNPRRDVPRAVISALLLSTLVYLALQVVFIGAVPGHELIHGWSGVNLSSPYAELALSLNLTWLSWLLYADAIVSPSGSALTFTATTARESYAMAKNRFLPAAIAKVDRKSGVPRRAMLVNFVIGLAFLLPFHSWQKIVAATSELGLFAYSITAVSAASFRRSETETTAHWIKGMRVLAPVSFVIASLILYWATWQELRIALPVLLVGAAVYAVQQFRGNFDRHDLVSGLWIVAYLIAILIMSAIGSFGGTKAIPAPWDSVIVAIVGLIAFYQGVKNGVEHLSRHPAPEIRSDDDIETAGAATA
jgi:amino acid transporter